MDDKNIRHYSIRVVGRVQGVFFRASAADKARQLKVGGFVRNERDGSVYIEVEGENERVKKFIEWAAVGPPRAVVESVDVTEGDVKSFASFEIQR